MILDDLAREAWQQADGDVDAAVDTVMSKLKADPALMRSALDPMLQWACRSAVETIMRASRHQYRQAASAPSQNVIDGLRSRAERVVLNLMDFPLRGGKKLGDATGSELIEEAVDRESRASTMIRDARWFRLIAADLSAPTIVVRCELKPADLERLQRNADGQRSAA
jgi:hypothetical protein